MSHPDLDDAAQARLRALADPASPAPHTDPGSAIVAASPADAPSADRRTSFKRRVREAARPVTDPALDRLAGLVAGRLRNNLRSEYDELAIEVETMRATHTALQQAFEGVNAFGTGDAARRIAATEINAELMKAELAAFRAALHELGQAIAPAAGLDGVPARFAELREQINAIDRRVRAAAGSPTTAAPDDREASVGSGSVTDSATGGFDYVGFERRFRGDSDAVLTILTERYAELLRDHQPVLDFGCGRGELVGALSSSGINAEGVDPDAGMVAEARGNGRTVHLGDGIEYLRGLPEHSLGAIISVHVVEHLPLPVLVELLELAASRLRPGGVFVAETPNPMSLIVLGNSYILDPTHVWPLHPSLMTFLAERAGFRAAELAFYAPAEAYELPAIEPGPDRPDWVDQINDVIERLNAVLFGPQEYAIITRTPPA